MSDNLPFEVSLLSDENYSLIENFSCGSNPEMDRCLKEEALVAQNSGKGVTYLVISKSDRIRFYNGISL